MMLSRLANRWMALICLVATGLAPVRADEPTELQEGLLAAGDYYLAVDVQEQELLVRVYDPQRRPVAAEGLRGHVVLTLSNDPRRYRHDLYPRSKGDSHQGNTLAARLPAARLTTGKLGIEVRLYGLTPRPLQAETQWRVMPVTISRPIKATAADARAVEHQRLCPVMDKPLESMGGAWKTTLAGREMYLCCRGCVHFVKRDPRKYLAKLPAVLARPAEAGDAAKLLRQSVCPVRQTTIATSETAWKVTLRGQTVFVCSENCARKLQARPDRYLRVAGRAPAAVRPVLR